MFDEDFNMYGKRDKELAYRFYYLYGGKILRDEHIISYHVSSKGTQWHKDHEKEGLKKFKLKQAKQMNILLKEKIRKHSSTFKKRWKSL